MRTIRPIAAGAAAVLFTMAAACGASGTDEASEITGPGDDTTTTTEAPTTTGEDASNGDDVPTTENAPTSTTEDVTATTDEPPPTTTEPNGGEVGERQDYIDAIAEDFSGGGPFSRDEGECIGAGWVDAIGFDAIVDAGISPEEFATGSEEDLDALGIDEEVATGLYDAFGDCGIELREIFLEDSGVDPSPSEQSCLDDVLTDENLRESFVAEFSGESLDDDPFEEAMDCIEP